MDIIFYTTTDDPRTLRKTLTDAITIQCQVTDSLSIEKPVIKLSSAQLTQVRNRNYCYIADLGRYYYIKDPGIPSGGFYEVNTQEDYLMSFQNQILNSQVVADRSYSASEPYMPDPLVTDSGKIRVYQRKLREVFSNAATNNFVLMVGG